MGNWCSSRSKCGKPFSAHYEMSGVVLGTGAFGFVERCTHKDTNEKYAVKITRIGDINWENLMHVITENNICPHLKHDNIVKFHESIFERNWHYAVYEEIHGRCILDEVCAKQHYSNRDARNYMQQILSAIQYCHKRNIVHRDVRPENILLRPSDDRIKLIDFGYAVITRGDEKDLFGQVGTLLYMAPEIFQNSPYGKPVDMWSCGLLLYNLLSGLHPYVRTLRFPPQLLVNYDMNFLIGVNKSPAAWSLVKHLVNRDDNIRLTADGALAHEFITEIANSSQLHRESTIRNLKRKLGFSSPGYTNSYTATKESPLGVDIEHRVSSRGKFMTDLLNDAHESGSSTQSDPDVSDRTDVACTDDVSVAFSSGEQQADTSTTGYTTPDAVTRSELFGSSPSASVASSESKSDRSEAIDESVQNSSEDAEPIALQTNTTDCIRHTTRTEPDIGSSEDGTSKEDSCAFSPDATLKAAGEEHFSKIPQSFTGDSIPQSQKRESRNGWRSGRLEASTFPSSNGDPIVLPDTNETDRQICSADEVDGGDGRLRIALSLPRAGGIVEVCEFESIETVHIALSFIMNELRSSTTGGSIVNVNTENSHSDDNDSAAERGI